MKKVRYNDLENGMKTMYSFNNGEVFNVIKETKKQFVILKDGKEATISKNCIDFFTAIN